MPRGEQLTRQWSILSAIARARVSRRELAARFDVSLRTIARDIDALSLLFPITEEPDGIDILYSALPSLRVPAPSLTPEEHAALNLAKDAAVRAIEGAPYTPAFASALNKLARASHDAASRKRADMPDVFIHDFAPPARPEHQHLEALLDAALERHRVWMRYFSAQRQVLGERTIDPLALHRHPFGVHLLAYCHTRHDVLNFNVRLIREMRVTEHTFDPTPHAAALRALLETSFDGHHTPPIVDVHLRIAPPTASWARDRFFHATQAIEDTEDGHIHVTFRSGGLDAIASRVLSLGPDCQVIAPEVLRTRVRELAEKIVENLTDP